MLWPVVKALLGHYRRHPLQILLVWLGLTLGISIFVGVAAINQHAKDSYTDGERLFANPWPYLVRSRDEGSKIPQSLSAQLQKEGFSQCLPVDEVHLHTSDGHDLTITGLDTRAVLPVNPNYPQHNVSVLRLFQPPYPILINKKLAAAMAKKDGDYIQLGDGAKIGPIQVDDNGILSGSGIITDLAKLRKYSQATGFSSIRCGAMPQLKLERLRNILPPELILSRNSKTELESLTQAFHMNLMAMGMLAFLVGLFIFYQAMSLSFVQRQLLVGIMRQTGVSGWHLAKALLIELLVLIVGGWLCGNLLGLLLANKLIPTVATTLADLYDASVGLNVEWSWKWSMQSLLMALMGAAIACAWPLVRLLKSQPIRLTVRLSLVRFAGREFLWQAVCAILLAVLAFALYQSPHTPFLGFVLVALLLLSVALLIPFIVFQVFSNFSYRLPWIKVRWFFADAAASMSYRGVAVMAFMLAMSANIAVEMLVGSFRVTTEQWLTQRLASDIYIYPTNSEAGRVSSWLSKQDGVEEIWWRWEQELQREKGVLQVVSTGDSVGEQDAITIKLAIPDYWYYLHNSRSVLISESMSLKQRIRPGDIISFKANPGVMWQVAGIYYDYGTSHDQVMMSHLNWLSLYAGDGNVSLGIQLKPDATSASIVKSLKDDYHLSADRIFDNTNIHNKAMQVFDRTFIIADTLGNLTLVVAVFGIFFATVAGEMSKQRQVALLRCLGISGKELAVLSSLQLLLFGILSALFAMPLGIGVAHLMVEVVLRQSFGWTMPLYVIPWDYAETFIWTMAALLIAGAIPVAGIMRRTPMKSLRDAL